MEYKNKADLLSSIVVSTGCAGRTSTFVWCNIWSFYPLLAMKKMSSKSITSVRAIGRLTSKYQIEKALLGIRGREMAWFQGSTVWKLQPEWPGQTCHVHSIYQDVKFEHYENITRRVHGAHQRFSIDGTKHSLHSSVGTMDRIDCIDFCAFHDNWSWVL